MQKELSNVKFIIINVDTWILNVNVYHLNTLIRTPPNLLIELLVFLLRI
jgi:hypothetical protein